MPRTLPARASLDWLRKTAKQNLRALKAADPEATLADAQRALARDYGFSSWRALKAHVDTPARRDDDAVAAFLRAVAAGETDKVRAALADDPALLHANGPHPYWGGRPQALHLAIENERRDIFAILLDAGADPDGRNRDYDLWSPLMLALTGKAPDLAEALVAHGARIGLVEAMLMEDDALVDRLLAQPLPDAPNAGSLLAFARTAHAIDRLLARGVSATDADHWGGTPIGAMSRLGEKGKVLVRHLMLRGVAAAPEHYARLGEREVLALLIDSDPGIAKADAVMMGAVDFGRHDLVRWLLAQGAGANARSNDNEARPSALHSAAWNGDLEMVKLLVEAGADLHLRDDQYDAPPWGWATTALEVTRNARCAEVADWLARRMAGGG